MKELLEYSIENLFKNYGQYDRVVTLSFKQGSYAAKTYGQFLTGIFQYTRDERIILESTINSEDHGHNSGHVKLMELLKEVCDEQKEELLNKGIDTREIMEVYSMNLTSPKNKFNESDIKQLPEPIVIETDLSMKEYDPLTVGVYNSQIKNGYKLIPSELIELTGINLSRSGKSIDEIDDETLLDSNTEKIKTDILLHYLRSKERNGLLTESEDEQLIQLENQTINENLSYLRKALINYIPKSERDQEENRQILKRIIPLVARFETRRLTLNKLPVWIDLERYLHIYFHHVKEVQAGEYNKEKSAFSYDFNQIDRLIETVLNGIEEEIEKHFESKPDKPFKRHGGMGMYFQGDYYVIDIEMSGRLMTLYKMK